MVFIIIFFSSGGQELREQYNSAQNPQKPLFFKNNVLPPCSGGEPLITFDPDIGKHFAAFLSKIMTPSRDGKNKKKLLPCRFRARGWGVDLLLLEAAPCNGVTLAPARIRHRPFTVICRNLRGWSLP